MSPILLRRLSDEQLGGRLASGEAAAFDELYRRYVHRLAAYGAHLLGDGAAGDDVAQSALLKAYGALRDGRIPQQVRPWLFRIAHNVAIDLVKRGRELPSETLPDRPAAAAGETGALVAALAALPDRQRRVYVLRELHGLRIDETAGELGLTAAQVEQSLFAARNRLAEHLVFGDRLNCVAVQRLAAGPLDLAERRALKTHLRSCPACRSAVGARALALGPSEWLRWLGGLLATGGAPAAAKIGAVVAGATVAAGVPVAVERTNHRAAPLRPVQHTAPVAHHRPARVETQAPARTTPVRSFVLAVPAARTAPAAPAAPAPPPRRAEDRTTTEHTTTTREHRDTEREAPAPPPTTTTATTTGESGDGGHDGSGFAFSAPPPSVTQTPTTTAATTTSSGDGGGGDGLSGDGSSGDSSSSDDGR
ncbi:MAG TPA: sigma-70 family RNA polymerase sigma factor [Gaiellaceae bacterium]